MTGPSAVRGLRIGSAILIACLIAAPLFAQGVPILAHGSAKNVLIIGGGDCGIAEEVLKHKALKSVVQVEIDESVIEFSKEHFPEFTTPVFKDKRFEAMFT